MSEEDVNCSNCRFWKRNTDDGGECRRRSPPADTTAKAEFPRRDFPWARWPLTMADWWCGEWGPQTVRQTKEEMQ